MPGRRPPHDIRLPISRQHWRDLTFLHWRVEPASLADRIPDGLALDLFDGSAWLSLTPFEMRGVRLRGAPPVPGVSDFPETNLRTYVRDASGRDGLWFLSLDAGSGAAVAALRTTVGLPYMWSDMSVERAGRRVTYRCRRRWPGPAATSHVEVHAGPPTTDAERTELDDWLSGRWRGYSEAYGQLLEVPVVHQPWPLHRAELLRCEDGLTDAAGFSGLGAPDVVAFSPGVDADLGVPRPIRRRGG